MPLGGLALNQSFAGLDGSSVSAGQFGDLSHPMFYVIAALNGMLLLIPPMENKRLRLVLFYLKSQEQEKELLDVQERILKSNGQISTVTLDEPSLISIILLVLIALVLNKKFRQLSANRRIFFLS